MKISDFFNLDWLDRNICEGKKCYGLPSAPESMKRQTINILHFEDNEGDAVLLKEMLATAQDINFRVNNVPLLTEGLRLLAAGVVSADIILLDLNLPDSAGYKTFAAVSKAAADVPVIIMSGLQDEELAVKRVHEGAQDYLIKGQLTADLLVRCIRYGIERQRLRQKLQHAREQVGILQGLLPICCFCKNIRDDRGYWHQVEDYIHKHSAAVFSHSICPECAEKHYPELYSRSREKKCGGKEDQE